MNSGVCMWGVKIRLFAERWTLGGGRLTLDAERLALDAERFTLDACFTLDA